MVLRNIGLVRHRIYLGVSTALIDIFFVVRQMRQKPLGSLGLSRGIYDGDGLFVKLGDLFIAAGAQHRAR